jgi:histidyl-tRNA synthetase
MADATEPNVEKSEKVLKREEEKRRKKAEKEAKEAAKKEKAAAPSAGPVTIKLVANPPIDLDPCPGTRDFYPEDMRLREWLFGHFNAVAELCGFQNYDAPVLEMQVKPRKLINLLESGGGRARKGHTSKKLLRKQSQNSK